MLGVQYRTGRSIGVLSMFPFSEAAIGDEVA